MTKKENMSIQHLKSMYEHKGLTLEPYTEKEIAEAEEKIGPLPNILKEYYKEIGAIEDEYMFDFHIFQPSDIYIYDKESFDEMEMEYEGDFLVFSSEMQGVSDTAFKKEDCDQESPILYSNLEWEEDKVWTAVSDYMDEKSEEAYTFLEYVYEIAAGQGVEENPLNTSENLKLVKEVVEGKRSESDITQAVD